MTDNISQPPKKSLGQHWLNDPDSLAKIISYAELSPSDNVLEIGPGQGSLTNLLVGSSQSVVAVELDDRLAARLPSIIGATNLSVVNQSILEFDLTKLPNHYKVVANIPYYLTGNLLRILSESENAPSIVVLLIQKEVAERISAKPGNMSILSVITQFFWQVEIKEVISRSLFIPPPKVDSQIIVLRRFKQPQLEVENNKFFRLVKMGFSARRKTLSNSLANGLRLDKAKIIDAIKAADINENARPQTLSIDDWHKLYLSFLAKNLI